MAVTELLGLPPHPGPSPPDRRTGCRRARHRSVPAVRRRVFPRGQGHPAVGAALSVAALLALPSGPFACPLVDRIGPRRIVIAANLLRVATFIGYVFAGSLWQLVALAALTF